MKFKTAVLNHEGLFDVDAAEVQAHASELTLIDVRRPEEYTGELGHVAGAKLMTLETDFLSGIKAHQTTETIVFICRSGARSLRAAALAKGLGFNEVYNMAGGMIEWNNRKLPTVS